ncbi:UNVERIFIED_CONTAM: Poly [ADP-ribose] polymerase 1 [Sesamum radiatum]|uniref:Poly [ADP-ribose] polymerase n=1 Tax=Sesamum radiatum TaxID=300843 RepID=A0AAW2W376_SESRA
MASPPKPWKAEYAKSSRSSCKTCKNPIDKETLRLGKMVQASQFDGFMPMWNHAACILRKANQIKLVDDVEGLELLRWEDQQKIRKYIDGSVMSNSSAPAVVECGIEVSQTSRATCRCCNLKIAKGEIRISTKPEGQGARGLSWNHAKCYMEKSPTSQVEKFSGWGSLSDSDRATLISLVKKNPSTSKGTKVGHEEERDPLQESTSKGGAKRKRASESDQKSKISKAGGNAPSEKNSSSSNTKNLEDECAKTSVLESQLEMQTRALWALKDELKKYVTTSELREMLEANEQDSKGSELDLRERCADGMLFGALAKCPMCSGSLHYSSGMYRCGGYLSEWSKCSYSTTEPQRVKAKWKIPEETGNEYLLKWFKSQKMKKPERMLPPTTPGGSSGSKAANGSRQSSVVENIGDLKVAIAGGVENKIEGAGGQVHMKIKKETNCLAVCGVLDDSAAEMRKARRMKIPIVREDYLVDCIKRQKKLPFDLYRVETTERTHGMATVKVKGQSAVHESSGLQDSGHILEDGKSIYNTTLNMSDLSTGVNSSEACEFSFTKDSYYILQIIQDDKSSDCYVFRKWGRVGNEKIGGVKLEEMSKSDAIHEFKRLFLEKTGNLWESWEDKKDFHKQPGRFYPLDIDYGVKDLSKKKQLNFSSSQLAPQLVELMKMLFNVETYRAAMMEFEINLSEMPLGKLSKSNIQKESLLVDASNRFFTVIPSIHPHVIKDEDEFKAKVKMLEALQDIEIASRLVGFDADSDESIDEKYSKLRCQISPLSRDSEDFKLIEKYLNTTHAPTHTEWALELEEVFSLEREGEVDKYAAYRAKLKNRMLLWHGSRLTNFVGILSQGLRIAPPEAPVTGYMVFFYFATFGKGVYFADLVSKSAQYCYTDRKNPVGLMLLSEVALGEYMDKPPKGKHSTKGLGKKVPLESEHVNGGTT